jgi:type II secretory pathway pseudopilin PulG
MNDRKAFTIVELITSVTIIALLLGILLPSVSMIRSKAKETAQKAQFATIDMALDTFKQDYGDYPPSNWLEIPPLPPITNYCGAQKLTEALVGWDLMGFHPKSNWRALGNVVDSGAYDSTTANLQERKGPYLELATANAFRLGDLFSSGTAPLAPNTFVFCDVFRVRKLTDGTGKPVTAGAPILYYKANTAYKTIDPNVAISARIYDCRDNLPLMDLGKLTVNGIASSIKHPLSYDLPASSLKFPVFYNDRYSSYPTPVYGGSGIGYGIRDSKVTTNVWPYRPDSYVLISAGPDGYYGTADDIHNY